MSRTVSLAAGVLPEHPPEAVAEAAKAAGFRAVGLRIDEERWTTRRVTRLRTAIERAGLSVLDVEVLWIRPGPANPLLLDLVEIASDLRACNLLVVSSDPDPAATCDKLAAICTRAQRDGLAVSLEFGHFSAVHTLEAAAGIVEATGCENARVLIDPLHLSRSRGSIADVAAQSPGLFSYAQFCDAGPIMPEPRDLAAIRQEALDGRTLPGHGVLPLRPLLETLPQSLPISVELRSKELREAYVEPVARARRVLDGTRRWLLHNGLS